MEWSKHMQLNYRDLEGPLKNINLDILSGIMHTAKLIDFIASKYLEEYDLSLSQFEVLCEVYFCSKQLNLSDISKALRVSKPTISGLVGRLKKKNYIHLIDSEYDSRVSYIHLTPIGEEVVKQTVLHYAAFAEELLQTPTEDQKKVSVNVLSALYKRLLESPMMEVN